MEREDSPGHPGWWARMPDGGIKRLWVSKHNDTYECRLEVCSAEQEAARQRLVEELERAQTLSRPPEPASSFDARVWASATIGTLQTNSPAEALEFLGNDDLAREALRDAEHRATQDAAPKNSKRNPP